MFTGLLTTIVFLPVAAGAVVALVARTDQQVRWASIAVSVVTFALSVFAFASYYADPGGVQFIDRFENWIPIEGLRSQYLLGIDGLSAPLIMLTGLLGAVAAWASWRIQHRVREYYFWLLALISAVMGVFASLDLLLFFVFFEFELIPMFMLISIWGTGRARYSAMKFVLFTLFGGAFLLVAIIGIYVSIGTFQMVAIPTETGQIISGIPERIAGVGLIAPAAMFFAFFLIAFAVKLPLWPLHNWLPDAHTDAPTAVSVLLAGVLLKMAGYGLLRINVGFFQETKGFTIHETAGILAALAAVSTLYGAIVTIRQTDMKRLIAFSSISHMGFVVLGVSAIAGSSTAAAGGLNGAAMQMFTHGTITGLAFLVVGLVYDRAHTRYIPHLGGLWRKMPAIGVFFLIAGFASLGLPGTSGFVSEIMVFLSTFEVWAYATGLAAFGVVLAAGYILWMVQRTFFGPAPAEGGMSVEMYENLEDASRVDLVPVVALSVAILVVGIWPQFLTNVFKIGIEATIR